MAAITKKGGRLVEFELRSDLPGVGDEFVGDLMQRDLGHIEAVGKDQLQQQIERTLEVRQPDTEALFFGRRRFGHLPKRSMTSRASDRYACAPTDFGAQVVMGSPATLVSGGKRTVRLMTVSNTRSPKRSSTRAITSRALTVRLSNRVIRMPLIVNRGLSRSRTLSTVSVSSASPRSEKYSHSVGMTTASEQASALTVSRPSDGWQSIRT